MTPQLAKLSGRIRTAVSELERIATLACRRCKKSLQDDDYLGSVAFDLQSFYQGLERIFLLVAGNIDGAVPSGENWHRELLDQMARELPGRRPAVISESSRDLLQAFRRFRHLARNIYAFDLEPERVRSSLIESI